MKKYTFHGPLNPNLATASIKLHDGRKAGVGAEISLSKGEYELLSQTVKLTPVAGDESDEETAEDVTDHVLLPQDSGTVDGEPVETE